MPILKTFDEVCVQLVDVVAIQREKLDVVMRYSAGDNPLANNQTFFSVDVVGRFDIRTDLQFIVIKLVAAN